MDVASSFCRLTPFRCRMSKLRRRMRLTRCCIMLRVDGLFRACHDRFPHTLTVLSMVRQYSCMEAPAILKLFRRHVFLLAFGPLNELARRHHFAIYKSMLLHAVPSGIMLAATPAPLRSVGGSLLSKISDVSLYLMILQVVTVRLSVVRRRQIFSLPSMLKPSTDCCFTVSFALSRPLICSLA